MGGDLRVKQTGDGAELVSASAYAEIWGNDGDDHRPELDHGTLLFDALKTLPTAKVRMILVERVILGRSLRDIAKETGVPKSTVAIYETRIRAIIKDLY